MLGSNIKVNRTLVQIPDDIRHNFNLVAQQGTFADRASLMRTYRNALDTLESEIERDLVIANIVERTPYTENFTYGHFVHVLAQRYMQCTENNECEMLRLKYYPLATIDPEYSREEWQAIIEEIQVNIEVESPIAKWFLKIFTFGLYKGQTKAPVPTTVAKVEKTKDKPVDKPADNQNFGLTGNH